MYRPRIRVNAVNAVAGKEQQDRATTRRSSDETTRITCRQIRQGLIISLVPTLVCLATFRASDSRDDSQEGRFILKRFVRRVLTAGAPAVEAAAHDDVFGSRPAAAARVTKEMACRWIRQG